jgi:putative ABC transport system substrate-binding protein
LRFNSALERMPFIDLTKKYRLPSMWEWREQVEDGGLMSYGSSLAERAERISEHIDRIFKGRAPGDLPVDRPMSFELAVNLKAAKALSITIPPIIMVQVTRVIE